MAYLAHFRSSMSCFCLNNHPESPNDAEVFDPGITGSRQASGPWQFSGRVDMCYCSEMDSVREHKDMY